MRGEIDFKESFAERVALLKGLDSRVMQEIAEEMPITEGVDRLMSVLKRCGYKIAILSELVSHTSENICVVGMVLIMYMQMSWKLEMTENSLVDISAILLTVSVRQNFLN